MGENKLGQEKISDWSKSILFKFDGMTSMRRKHF